MTKRVEAVHRFDVPVDRGFAFITDTGNWSSFWPGFVRLEDGTRWHDTRASREGYAVRHPRGL